MTFTHVEHMELSQKANPAKNNLTNITNCIKKLPRQRNGRHDKTYTIITRFSKSINKNLNLKSIFKYFKSGFFICPLPKKQE